MQFNLPVPALIGALVAMKFDLSPLAIAVVASAAYVGSGAAQFKNGAWMITGIGDLINTMITAAIAVLFILLIQHRVGSMALIVFPTVVGRYFRCNWCFNIAVYENDYNSHR
ncbi:membrane spanning protein [Staphylococcus aureus]|uniref:Membrane spanning protein n=1 Tax=Staphylococcus aureus TaxID=1280 RepID=A0A380DR77_STAAU|nr:membrane spanning protein [Staphylococcus aureus]